MMRVICLLLVSLFALKVNAQQYTKFNGYGFQADRIKSDSISIHPSDTIRNKAARSIAVLNGVFYIADGTKWKVVGTDTTSLSNRINLKLNIADTINKWVTNVYKVNDSTIAVLKNGVITNITLTPAATKLVTSVYNKSGALIPKGSVVYIDGAHSSVLPSIALAKANKEESSAYTYGLVESDISNNAQGIVIQSGVITNLNLPTSSYTDGQTLYLSPTVAGGFTTTKPLAPNHYVAIGTIIRAHPNFGTIQIAIRNGFQLDELSDVSIALVPLDSTILQFSRVDSLWHDVNPTTAMGNRFIKPTDTATMLTPYSRGSGTSGQVAYWNATRSLTGSSGFTFTPTSSLLLNNSVTAASAIARGQNITSTLTAAANSDVLVGLDVNPTFTNGSFTGVTNTHIRALGTNSNTSISNGNITITDTRGSTNTPLINFITSTFSSQIIAGNSTYPYAAGANSLNFYHSVSGPIAFYNGSSSPTRRLSILSDGKIIIGTGNSSTKILDITETAASGGINLNSNTSQNLNFVFNNTTSGAIPFSINSSATGSSQTAGTLSIGATTNNLLLFSSGNTVLGGLNSSDAGYKLDVNGTARVVGNLTNDGTIVSNNATMMTNGSIGGVSITTTNNRIFINAGANVRVTDIGSISGTLNMRTNGTIQSGAVFNFAGGLAGATGLGYNVNINSTNSTQSGGNVRILNIEPTLSTDNATSTFKGIYYNPTISGLLANTSHNAIETVTGNVLLGTTSGSVGIGANTSINASAIVDVTSTTKGFLPPRMTTAQRDLISSPAAGLIIYNTSTNKHQGYNGSTWNDFY